MQDEAELVSKVYSALVNACGIMACVMGIVIIQALDNKVKNMYYNFDSIYAVYRNEIILIVYILYLFDAVIVLCYLIFILWLDIYSL